MIPQKITKAEDPQNIFMLLPLGFKLNEHFKQPKMKNETAKLLILIWMSAFSLTAP